MITIPEKCDPRWKTFSQSTNLILDTFILHVFLLRKRHWNLTSASRLHTGLTPLAAATSHVFLGPIVSPLLLKTLPMAT